MAVYNWYPGHMAKARRAMTEDIKLIDIIVELIDARAPYSSRNPDIEKLGAGKERIIVLNKADLADPKINDCWTAFFKESGARVVALNSRDRQGFRAVLSVIDDAARKKRERDLKRGIKNRPVRLMVCGIPNVGKSTFINSLCRKNIAKTGNKPGVTKGKQWISVMKGVDLMDTPGILWPRIDDPVSQKNLAMTGSMNDEAIDRNDLIHEIVSMLKERAGDTMASRFDVNESDDTAGVLQKVALSMHMVRPGGENDTDRAASFLITEYRSGNLGRISLEQP